MDKECPTLCGKVYSISYYINVYLEIYIPFLFESVKKLNKGTDKILRKSICIILAPSMHIHTCPYVGRNCGVFSSVCIPFKSRRNPRENNFHPQHQIYFFSSILYMCII